MPSVGKFCSSVQFHQCFCLMSSFLVSLHSSTSHIKPSELYKQTIMHVLCDRVFLLLVLSLSKRVQGSTTTVLFAVKHAGILNELHIFSINPFEDFRSVIIIDFLNMLCEDFMLWVTLSTVDYCQTYTYLVLL